MSFSPTVGGSAQSSSTGGARVVDVREMQRVLLQQRISNMFRRYVPTKLHRLDVALARYYGKEDLLLRSLVAKFGPEPSFNVEQQELLDSLQGALVAAAGPSSPRARPTEGDGNRAPAGGRSLSRLLLSPSPPLTTVGQNLPSHDVAQRDDAPSPRGHATPPLTVDPFPAAVALVAHHHHLRSRLFEAYTAKRSVIRMQEEKERDAVVRSFTVDFRHISSSLTRKQAEALMMQQREKAAQAEQVWQQKRLEEVRAAWISQQSAILLQKALHRKEDLYGEERSERRALSKLFTDGVVKLFRLERRVARLREAAEVEARNAVATPASQRATASRQKLEAALHEVHYMVAAPMKVLSLESVNDRRNDGKSNGRKHSSSGGSLASSDPQALTVNSGLPQVSAHQRRNTELALLDDLGTAVSSSVGAVPLPKEHARASHVRLPAIDTSRSPSPESQRRLGN